MTAVLSAIVEAWDELRLHKLRVLLALIGVAVAVCAITAVTALAQTMTQVMRESMERDGGRPASLQLTAYPTGSVAPPLDDYLGQYETIVTRYGIEHSSRELWSSLTFRFPDGARQLSVQAVDPAYGVMRRVQPAEGRWLSEQDAGRLAPSIVVNEAFLDRLGLPDLSSRPTVMLGGATPVRCTVVGVMANLWSEEEPRAFMTYEHFQRWGSPPAEYGPAIPSLLLWVPEELAPELSEAIARDARAGLPGTSAEVYRTDSDSWNALQGGTRWVITGISGIALLLGGLGLLNIALVTVRHRIREIGVRRSFGATSGRVFFGVLMESVVATVVAGLVGVALAIVGLKSLPVERLYGTGVQDLPPFPMSAALIGLACATGVGALAGLIPAIVAVRVKVIDAIRY